MKTGFTLTGRAESLESALLLRIALCLQERRMIPDRLIWTRLNAREIKLEAEFSPVFAASLPDLVNQLLAYPGVQSAELRSITANDPNAPEPGRGG